MGGQGKVREFHRCPGAWLGLIWTPVEFTCIITPVSKEVESLIKGTLPELF